MCIALLSTAHPDYPLIVLDNRDEFFSRPTAQADWWKIPNEHVLGGRDLQRAENGTWLGITKQGRFAVLTNFRDEGVEVNKAKSRGGIATSWLTSSLEKSETPEEFVNRLIRDTGIHDVGGFSLWVGQLGPSNEHGSKLYPGVSVISNRTSSTAGLSRIATKPGETHGLSNSHFGDRSWPKVVRGEELFERAIQEHIKSNGSEDSLIESLFQMLATDSLPKPTPGEPWHIYVRQLRNSIFIPPISEQPVDAVPRKDLPTANESKKALDEQSLTRPGAYGTQQQTIILVDRQHRVKFIQRTLYGSDGVMLSPPQGDKVFEFNVT